MPIQPDNLIAPRGEIETSMFPATDLPTLEARIQEYIDQAYLKVPGVSDLLAEAWAYHRAFLACFVRLTSTPHQVDVSGEGGHSFLISQIQAVKERSDYYLAIWEAGTIATPPSTKKVASMTTHIPIDYTY